MPHPVSYLLAGVKGKYRDVLENTALRRLLSRSLMSLVAVMLISALSVSGQAQSAPATPSPYVPPAVVSSIGAVPVPASPLPTGSNGQPETTCNSTTESQVPLINPTFVLLDACGNVYTLDRGHNSFCLALSTRS